MKKTRAERTRADVMAAALQLFVQRGIRATTLEDIAIAAGVTRGAVYWHFPDKAALVHAIFERFVWPLDIGADLAVCRASLYPQRTLCHVLKQHMQACMDDPEQWRMMTLLLRFGSACDLQERLSCQFELMSALAVLRLAEVLGMPCLHGGLRPGLKPLEVARSVHGMALAILAEQIASPLQQGRKPLFSALDLLLAGACPGDMPAAPPLVDGGEGAGHPLL